MTLDIPKDHHRVILGKGGTRLQKLELDTADVYPVSGPLALSDFMRLTGLPEFERLTYPSWPPQSSPGVDPRASMF